MVRQWLLPNLSEVFSKIPPIAGNFTSINPLDPSTILIKTVTQWQSALTSLEQLLSHQTSSGGLLITTPNSLLTNQEIIKSLDIAVFYPASHSTLPPCSGNIEVKDTTDPINPPIFSPIRCKIPVLPTDPLGKEQFTLFCSRNLSILLLCGEDEGGIPQFQFTFDPAEIIAGWESLRGRFLLTAPKELARLDQLFEKYYPHNPDYRIITAFSHQLLQDLPLNTSHSNPTPTKPVDLQLLELLTHEIRTPLTTIRTFTRSLLKRSELPPGAIRRLEMIDQECTEQINRMELIFRAVELANNGINQVDLTTTSFHQILAESLPQWQQQAEKRNLNLEVEIPNKLPPVVTNPMILEQILTGLIEKLTRNLPAGSRIQVEVSPVGDCLKLQLHSSGEHIGDSKYCRGSFTHQAIGQLLTFQPETGNLSLNLNVTKNLCQILGGKLIVKQNPDQGETLTIFLPIN